MRYKKIITHSGSAHRDEFIACCLVLAHLAESEQAVTIYRCNPTEEDLNDPTVIVIDTGLRGDWGNSNFDHHQHDRDAKAQCSITAVLRGLLDIDLDDAREAFPWLTYTEWLDSKGPVQTAAEFGLPTNSFTFTSSPIEGQLLTLFQTTNKVESSSGGTGLWQLMTHMGQEWLRYINKYFERQVFLTRNAKPILVDGLWVVDATCVPANEDPTLGLEPYVKNMIPLCAVIVTCDAPARGEGFQLYRRNDHPLIDFSKIERHEDVKFAHKSGFIAKTFNRNVDFVKLISLSRVAQS